MSELRIGIYRHYKGKEYEVIGVGRDTETLKELVIYRALYDSPEFGNNALWARPKEMFLEKVVHEGSSLNRFTFVRERSQ